MPLLDVDAPAPDVAPGEEVLEGEVLSDERVEDAPAGSPAAAEGAEVIDIDVAEPAPRDVGEDAGEVLDVVVEEPEDALAAALRERDEYLDHLRRERAEFDNYRRRTSRERSDALDRGAEALVTRLLGVVDNLGFALDAAAKSEDTNLAKGVELVAQELLSVLRDAGLEEVPGVGAPFDPNLHEAMGHVESAEGPSADEPTVAAVMRPGWRFKGRVLRPATVSVAH